MTQLTFDEEYHYKDDEEGIPISVILMYGDKTVRTDAKVDPGSAVCFLVTRMALTSASRLSKATRLNSAV